MFVLVARGGRATLSCLRQSGPRRTRLGSIRCRGALDIFAPDQADEPAIGRRHKRGLVAPSVHVPQHFDRAHIGPERARPGAHDISDAPFRITLELGLEYAAEYDALLVHDDAGPPGPRRLAGDAHRVVETTGGHIAPREVLEADGACGRALEGEPVRAPVSLAG